MPFLAKYNGFCPRCKKDIVAGVHYVSKEKEEKMWRHANCSSPARRPFAPGAKRVMKDYRRVKDAMAVHGD